MGAGLSSSRLPPVQQVQIEAGTHPVTVGFSTVWLSLATRVPRVLAQTAVHCKMCEMPLHGPFIPCCLLVHPMQLVFYLHDYLFANKFIAEIYFVFSCIQHTVELFSQD